MGEFYKMEYDAWDEGTVELSLEEEAAYLRLCHQMYRRKQPVPVTDRMLCSLWRCHQNKARPLLQRLIDKGKISLTEDGRAVNGRTARELDARETLRTQRAHAGHTGGIRSADVRRKSLKSNDQPKAKSSRVEERREEENRIHSPNGECGAFAPPQADLLGETIKPKVVRKKPKTSWPKDFALDERGIEYAADKGFRSKDEIARLFDRFRDHHQAKGNQWADWNAAWRTWVNNEIKFNAERRKPSLEGVTWRSM